MALTHSNQELLCDQAERELWEMVQAMRTRVTPGARAQPRASKRTRWRAEVEVQIDETMGGGVRTRSDHVRTLDISTGGIAFLFQSYVQPGAGVSIDLPLPGKPCVEGVVRNCVHMRGRFHRVGVQLRRIVSQEELEDQQLFD